MVVFKMDNGQVSTIQCADASCCKSLSDHDIKRMGLTEELVKKYERFSYEQAIAQMDDIGFCPMGGCNSHADLDTFTNTGRC